MPDDLLIRSAVSSVEGNMLLIYLAARKLQQTLGTGRLANISLPAFGIRHPDEPIADRQGLHLPPQAEVITQGRVFAEQIGQSYRK